MILDPPEVPLKRTSPKKKKSVMFAGIFGIGLGIGMAFIWEYVRIKKEEEKKIIVQAQSLLIKNLTQMYNTLLSFLKAITPFKLK